MSDVHDTRKRRNLIYDVGMHMGEDTEFYLPALLENLTRSCSKLHE